MSASGYNTRGRIACVKCKQRHKPPVGTSCTRLKAARPGKTTTAVSTNHINLGSVDAAPGLASENAVTTKSTTVGQLAKKKHPSTAEVMEKLDIVLNRFEDIEKRLDSQERRNSHLSVLTQPSAHSSPKRKESRSAGRSCHSHNSGELPSMDYL